jgi:hypothetical protein
MAHVKLPMIDAMRRNEILPPARAASHLALTDVALLSDGNENESLAE